MVNKEKEIFYAILDIKLIFSQFNLSTDLYINRIDNKIYYYSKKGRYINILNINLIKKIDSLKKAYIDKDIKIIHIGSNIISQMPFPTEYTVDEYIDKFFQKEKRLHNLDKFI